MDFHLLMKRTGFSRFQKDQYLFVVYDKQFLISTFSLTSVINMASENDKFMHFYESFQEVIQFSFLGWKK